MAAPTILSPGAKVGGKYEVVEVIGFGGMGVVYKVREQVGAVSRIRALKTVLPQYAANKAVVTRFRQEAEKMCLLEHENIVPVLSYSEEGEFPYLVMPFIEGQTLKEYLASYVGTHGRGLPLADTVEIGMEIARGLEVAHRFVQPDTHRTQPMVHRDIKPGNIMVRVENQGGERRLKVLIMDFGIAKLLSTEDTARSLTEVIGTVRYASPEQLRRHKDVDPCADIYSLGMVLYEIYCGRHLFAGVNEHSVLMRMVQKDVQDHDITFPDEAPERFRQLIARAIAIDRDRRFANVEEMRGVMRRILDEDSERVSTAAKHAHDFARSERARAVEQQAERLCPDSLGVGDRKLAEGETALADRRFAQAASILRTAAEAFARATEEAAEARERERLNAARAALSTIESHALAANAAELAAAEVAAAHRATALFEKASAGGDLSGAGRALAEAERAWREADSRAAEEGARREAIRALADLERAIAARRIELDRLPGPLRQVVGASDFALVEAKAEAARMSIAAGDFSAATSAAREGGTMLVALQASSEKALADAAQEREHRFAAELSAVEADGDIDLAPGLHSQARAVGVRARERIAARRYAEAVTALDEGLGSLKALTSEIAAQRAERDRRLEAAERNRRAEGVAKEAAAAVRAARDRLNGLPRPEGRDIAELAAVDELAAAGEREAAAGEFAAAAPRLREAGDRLERLCAEIATREEAERKAQRLAELRLRATHSSRDLGALGAAVSSSADARRLVAALASAEQRANSGDSDTAIRILEETVRDLDVLVAQKRVEVERDRQLAEARAEITRAVDAENAARGLGERATTSPAFAEATVVFDRAKRSFESGDFSRAATEAVEATRVLGNLSTEVRRIERDERLATIRHRRETASDRIASLPAGRAVQRARKAFAKSIAKLDAALSAQDDVEAARLATEIELWVESLVSRQATETPLDAVAAERAFPWRIAALGGGVAAAAAATLWFALAPQPERIAREADHKATQAPATPHPADTPPPAATTAPTALPAPTAVPPTTVPVAPVEPLQAPPLELASARPAPKSVTIRAGAQQRFEASLKNGKDAVLEWRFGGDAVGIGETFVLGKPLSERPGRTTLELVASRGHDHATLRSWEVAIEAPPLGFGRLDPPSAALERPSGARVTFRAPVNAPESNELAFQWQVNGETARGAAGPSYEFDPEKPGEYLVAVRATAPWGASIANTWKLSVRAPPPPTPALVEPPRPAGDPKAEAQAWIQSYCSAFQTKDTDALLALGHLTTQAEASRLREALAGMTNLRVSCSNPSVRVSGDQAVVSFDRTDRWTDPRGSEMERALPRITKTLRRNDGRWVAVQ